MGGFGYNAVYLAVQGGNPVTGVIRGDTSFQIVFDYLVEGILPPGRLAFQVLNQEGMVVFSSADTDSSAAMNRLWPTGRTVTRCEIPGRLLAPGSYSLTISEPDGKEHDIIHENIINFTISEQNSLVARDGRPGIIMPMLSWHEEMVEDECS